jgi:hypothetical protein
MLRRGTRRVLVALSSVNPNPSSSNFARISPKRFALFSQTSSRAHFFSSSVFEMSDDASSAAAAPPPADGPEVEAEGTVEVGGETISKSEQKRRLKAAQKEKEKAEKAAAKAAKEAEAAAAKGGEASNASSSKGAAAAADEELDPSRCVEM